MNQEVEDYVGEHHIEIAELLEEKVIRIPLGLCHKYDPDTWFPERGGRIDKPRAICQACPARLECLADSCQRPEEFGIWGGASPLDRRAIRLLFGLAPPRERAA